MTEKKSKSFFWASYADLMTSLFFIMLMLFVVAVVELNKKNGILIQQTDELNKMNGKLIQQTDSLSAQLKKAREIENATKDLDPVYFEYIAPYKKHKLSIDVSFPTSESDINRFVPDSTKIKLYLAGKKVKEFIDSTISNHKGIQYLLIIEGQASKDKYTQNYELSYKRALALKKFWEKGYDGMSPIKFSQENCEVLICGSGDGSQSGTGLMRDTNERLNQRFLIHILPKPGIIEEITKQKE